LSFAALLSKVLVFSAGRVLEHLLKISTEPQPMHKAQGQEVSTPDLKPLLSTHKIPVF
jgi:hypothetical protein